MSVFSFCTSATVIQSAGQSRDMRTLAFDGQVGASGDMILGALLDAGADPEVLSSVEEQLDVTYRIEPTRKCGLAATSVTVELDSGAPAEGHHHHRHYTEVIDLLDEMELPEHVRDDAAAIFEVLGRAEATVHDTTLEEIAFHEVGADDAIADVVGVALLVDDLEIERILTTPIALGGGELDMSHGVYPVPGPATAEIIAKADWETRGGPVNEELLTPTGAAILTHYATGVESLPPLSITKTGYGAGDLDLAPRPNVLRAVLGTADETLRADSIRVIETNVDDVSPEELGDLQRSLTAAGARDVSIVPVTMKKSRPGHLIKVIVKPEDVPAVTKRLAEETGTLGIRDTGVAHRWIADRELRTASLTIDSETYEIDVKVAFDAEGAHYDVSAEYDDLVAVADATGRPLRELRTQAERIIEDRIE